MASWVQQIYALSLTDLASFATVFALLCGAFILVGTVVSFVAIVFSGVRFFKDRSESRICLQDLSASGLQMTQWEYNKTSR
jgi:hypothetical protein